MPFWDEWNADLPLMYALDRGALTWRELFLPHNEHRVLLTRLVALAVYLADGQWDSRTEMTLNAVVFTAMACFMAAAGRRLAGGRAGALVLAGTAFLWSMPFAYQNLLWGFQNQFYFLLLFTLLVVAVTWSPAPEIARTAVGGACAVVGLYAMASGVLIAVVAGGLSAVAAIFDRAARRGHLRRVAFHTLVVVVAATQWVTVERHRVQRANGLAELLLAFGKAAAWPFSSLPWMALVMWLPFLLWLVAMLRRIREVGPADWALAATGGWVVAQCLASAYARGAGAPEPYSRYLDLLAVGLLVNLVVGLRLARHLAPRPRLSAAAWIGMAGWGIAAAGGVGALSLRDRDDSLPTYRATQRVEEANVRGFLVTDSPGWIVGKAHGHIPYHQEESLQQFLRHPFTRRILPASVRVPLVTTAPPEVAGFQPTPGASEPVPAWTSAGVPEPARWRGHLVAETRLPYLRVDVRGAMEPGLAVELAGGGEVVRMEELKRPRDEWFPVYGPKPRARGDFDLVARDETPDFDFAFTAPVEVGRLTYYSERALALAEYLMALGAAAGLAWAVERWRTRRATGAGTA